MTIIMLSLIVIILIGVVKYVYLKQDMERQRISAEGRSVRSVALIKSLDESLLKSNIAFVNEIDDLKENLEVQKIAVNELTHQVNELTSELIRCKSVEDRIKDTSRCLMDKCESLESEIKDFEKSIYYFAEKNIVLTMEDLTHIGNL